MSSDPRAFPIPPCCVVCVCSPEDERIKRGTGRELHVDVVTKRIIDRTAHILIQTEHS